MVHFVFIQSETCLYLVDSVRIVSLMYASDSRGKLRGISNVFLGGIFYWDKRVVN